MTYKIEIEIKDDVLWNALCKYSAISGLKVSEAINRIGIERGALVLFKAALNDLMKDEPLVQEAFKSEPEITLFLQANK